MFSNNNTRTLNLALNKFCLMWKRLLKGNDPLREVSVFYTINDDETVNFRVYLNTNCAELTSDNFITFDVVCVADSPVAAINDCQKVMYKKLGDYCK